MQCEVLKDGRLADWPRQGRQLSRARANTKIGPRLYNGGLQLFLVGKKLYKKEIRKQQLSRARANTKIGPRLYNGGYNCFS